MKLPVIYAGSFFTEKEDKFLLSRNSIIVLLDRKGEIGNGTWNFIRKLRN